MYDSIIEIYISVGCSAFEHGQYRSAGKMFLEAARESKYLRNSDPRRAIIYSNLALFYLQQKRYNKSETYYRRALGIFEANPSTDERTKLDIYNKLFHLCMAQSKSIEAQEWFDKTNFIRTSAIAVDREMLLIEDAQSLDIEPE